MKGLDDCGCYGQVRRQESVDVSEDVVFLVAIPMVQDFSDPVDKML